jgi:hypothetical protein
MRRLFPNRFIFHSISLPRRKIHKSIEHWRDRLRTGEGRVGVDLGLNALESGQVGAVVGAQVVVKI